MLDHDDEPEGLSVAQMAETTGVTGYTLRYYERAGLIHAIARTSGNQRRYRASDVEWVRFLLRLRETGMPIAQMRCYAALRAQGGPSLRHRLDMLTDHHRALRQQIKTLQAHERTLHTKIETYQKMIADTEDKEPDDE